jgi:hypothetical protein
MKFFTYFSLFAGVLATLIDFEERQAPDPSQIYIIDAKYAGTGCPEGSVATTIADDSSFVTFLFSDFVASIGPGTLVSDRSKNCQLQLNVHCKQMPYIYRFISY